MTDYTTSIAGHMSNIARYFVLSNLLRGCSHVIRVLFSLVSKLDEPNVKLVLTKVNYMKDGIAILISSLITVLSCYISD